MSANKKDWENKGEEVIRMKLKPLGDKVVVKPIKEEERTKGGIIIPDSATKEKPQEGTVIAVGDGKYTDNGTKIEMQVKENDRVIFSKYAGTEVKLNDDEEYLILSERDILAIVED